MQVTNNLLSFDNVLGKNHRFFYMGFAMIWIVGYHLYLGNVAFYDEHLKIVRNIFKYGYVGVDIFFFFSAYGLCHSYTSSSLKDFYIKRAIRIIPIYLLFETFKFFVSSHDTLAEFLHFRFVEITSVYVLQTELTCPDKIRLGWFVPAIINLYWIFPLLFKGIKWLFARQVYIHVLFLVVLFFGCHFMWGVIHGLYISRMPIICVGILTYFYLKERRYGDLFLVLAAFAFLTYFIERDNLRLSCLVPIILYGFSVHTPLSVKWMNRSISKVGELSFEVFLGHIYVGQIISTPQ